MFKYLYNIYLSILNIIYWFNTIWGDRHYNNYFIFIILQRKVKLILYNYYNSNNNHNSRTRVQDLEICLVLLDRILADEYHAKIFVDHEEKWGDLKYNPAISSQPYRTKAKTFEDKLQEKEEARILLETIEKEKQRDIDKLFLIMSQSIREW